MLPEAHKMIDRETQIIALLLLTIVPLALAAGLISSMIAERRERERVQRIFCAGVANEKT